MMTRALLAILVASISFGQSFEVASIRPAPESNASRDRSWGADSGMVNLRRVSLYFLIREAYRLQDYQLSGPDWLKRDFYDIVATAPAGTSRAVILRMLQSLLEERFRMTVHRETEERPVYALTVLQSGPKPAMEIQKEPGKDIAIESDRKGESVLRVLNDPNLGPYRMTSGRTGFHYEFESITLAALERFLNEGYLDRPLLDQTGLNGAYQITVDSPFPTNLVGSNEPAGDSVEDSLRKSGLQLVRTRANVEKLVIDRIARTPMEN